MEGGSERESRGEGGEKKLKRWNVRIEEEGLQLSGVMYKVRVRWLRRFCERGSTRGHVKGRRRKGEGK